MSYEEYRDLFVKAQNNNSAPYKCFSFDMKNSKTMNSDERYLAQIATFNTINNLTKKLLDIETQNKNKILLTNNEIKIVKNIPIRNNINTIYYSNPCFTAGDSFHFYTYNNSISDEEFLNLFIEALKEENNYHTYHFASGNFETTNYSEANKKYYVGYIIAELTNNKNNRKQDISLENQIDLMI